MDATWADDEYQGIVKVIITAEWQDLCSSEKEGKIAITLKAEESSTALNNEIGDWKDYGCFSLQGQKLPWAQEDPDDRSSLTATGEVKLLKCPSGIQEGEATISLDTSYPDAVIINGEYKLTWNYECCCCRGCCGEFCELKSFAGKVELTASNSGSSSGSGSGR